MLDLFGRGIRRWCRGGFGFRRSGRDELDERVGSLDFIERFGDHA